MTKKQQKMLRRIVISCVLLAAAMVVSLTVSLHPLLEGVLFFIPYLVIGYDILIKAGKGILNRQLFDENFLMAVATVGAMVLGEYVEAAAVMLFYQIGELFQSIAVGRSRKSIAALMDIRPDSANLLVDGEIEVVDPDEVEVGSTIVVHPGEKIPIDGIITKGSTNLDTVALTGESIPREAQEGDAVISGCINLSGVIHVETTKEFGESTVSKILELVESSGMKKSRSETFITRFARYYTPAVCFGALLLAILPPLWLYLSGNDPIWNVWLIRGLTFLVTSCPCALVISVPLSFFAGIGCASSKGILVKGSNYLEALGKTTQVVFDKTGTLTKGIFAVSSLCPAEGVSEETLLSYAAAVESGSHHPISLSLQKAWGNRPLPSLEPTSIKEKSGFGMEGIVEGQMVLAGNEKLMQLHGIPCPVPEENGTIVHVAVGGTYVGYIAISDALKPHAREAIAALRACGVTKTVMLTGDRQEAAKAIGDALSIDMVKSQLLPGDKVSEVEALLSEKSPGEVLAFVGDGINDAPVLSRADVGIAMGALGSDAAIEAADVVLMDDDPQKIALAIKISRRTVSIVTQNIAFSLLIKFGCLLLVSIGQATMWHAIFADVGVMVLAVLNATRALSYRQ